MTDSIYNSKVKYKMIVSHEEFGEIYYVAATLFLLSRGESRKYNITFTNKGQNLHTFTAELPKDIKASQVIFLQNCFTYIKQYICQSPNEYEILSKHNATDLVINVFNGRNEKAKKNIQHAILECFISLRNEKKTETINGFRSFLSKYLQIDSSTPKIIFFLRNKSVVTKKDQINWLGDGRDLTPQAMKQLIDNIHSKSPETEFIFMGDNALLNQNMKNSLYKSSINFKDMCNYYNSEEFQKISKMLAIDEKEPNIISGQLLITYLLYTEYNAKFAMGMMSGALDGPAFTGIPIIFFSSDGSDSRMARVSKVIPGFNLISFQKDYYLEKLEFDESAVKQLETVLQDKFNIRQPQANEKGCEDDQIKVKIN